MCKDCEIRITEKTLKAKKCKKLTASKLFAFFIFSLIYKLNKKIKKLAKLVTTRDERFFMEEFYIMQSSKYIKNNDKAITLIAMVVTIIILLILSGVTIATLTSDNGIINNAKVTKMATEFANYNEEVEQWKMAQSVEKNGDFKEDTLSAGKSNLTYDGEKKEGNIKNIIPDMLDDYLDEIEIIKGTLTINTTNASKIKAAKIAGIPSNPYEIKNGVLESTGSNLDLMASDGTLTIPENVTKIASGAFSGVKGLKTVIIPGSVEEISDYAFSYNATLENVVLNYGIKRIGANAFDNVSNLKSINFPDSLTEIASRAFRTTGLKEINIPGSVKAIKNEAFTGCASLSKITLNEGIERLVGGCFAYTNIESIDLPKTVIGISEEAFGGCKKLINVNINDNQNFVYESGMLMTKDKSSVVFASSSYLKGITTFKIPEGIKSLKLNIGQYDNITKLELPKSLSAINVDGLPSSINDITVDAENKYFKCENKLLIGGNYLELCYEKSNSVIIPEGIKTLGNKCFKCASEGCNIQLPDSLETIGDCGIPYKSSMKISKNVKYINPLMVRYQFDANITVDSKNPYFCVENKILYSKDKKKLVRVLYYADDNIKIDSGTEIIGEYAFYGLQNIKSLKLNEGIKELEKSAFTYCGLKKIELPSTLEKIGDNCFGDATRDLAQILIHKKENSISGAPWGAIKGMKVVEWTEK